jgi:AcrR family transcriptional regulator
VVNKRRGPGRPRGVARGREQILDAARALFLADGYDRVSLRAIAARAGVDAALISYYFGSKRGLFAAVMQLTTSPPEVARYALNGDPTRVAERLIAGTIAVWEDPERGAALDALFRSASREPDIARLVRELIERELVAVIAEHLGGADASIRASITASQITGLIFTRYIMQIEPLASMPARELVAYAAPALRASMARPDTRRSAGPRRR